MRMLNGCGLFALALLVLLPRAHAQDYPSRPVTLVAPYAAGGGADLVARLVAQRLGERLGQSFTVDNRLGAGGVIAASSVAKAAPDGHTLFMGTSTQLAIQVTLHKKLPYDPATDFAPVALVASVPFVLLVHPSLPVHSLTDLIGLAEKNPGALSFGSSGVGGPPHLYTELLKSMTGMQLTHVPYKGTAQAINDVVAGHVPTTYFDDSDIEVLAGSDTVATFLPATDFSTRQPYPDARRMIDAGARVAIATNTNPGSSNTTSMGLCIALAVREMKMTIEEALLGATLGGANALRRDDVGHLMPGARADAILLDASSYIDLVYRPGVPLVSEVFLRGRQA
ncbi:MAG: tripartite tricarboxylate transporter substrate-binding protein [Xanthobacteraceae bacterium]